MMKHMAADAKEKLGNVTAKVEEKMDKGKASATEKTDKAMAHDKAGKLEAKERKHEREAEAEHIKDQKKVDNAREVSDAKQDINERKTAASNAYHHVPTHTPATNDGLAQEGAGAGFATAPGGATF